MPERWMRFIAKSGHVVLINMNMVKIIRPYKPDGAWIDDIAVECDVATLALLLNAEHIS